MILIKSQMNGPYEPPLGLQFDRDTGRVFLDSIPPLEETPCSFRLFQLTREERNDEAVNKDTTKVFQAKSVNPTKNK